MTPAKSMTTQDHILSVLEATSRTFYIPIARMPAGLKEATTSAYLCMRAIDEIEDHPSLPSADKVGLLRRISLAFQAHPYRGGASLAESLGAVLAPWAGELPEVSLELAAWALHAPAPIAPRIWSDTAAMADRMAHWASVNWRIASRSDLDAYTYSVAAAVGLLMCDILAWHDGTQLDRAHAIHFGRALQVVNIARNRPEDIRRGADFYPPGWTDADMRAYAGELLGVASSYAQTLPPEPFSQLIRIPLALAEATLAALAGGQPKLSRQAVLAITEDHPGRQSGIPGTPMPVSIDSPPSSAGVG
jgi:farnesyl-diphosphate farnesyltransferase